MASRMGRGSAEGQSERKNSGIHPDAILQKTRLDIINQLQDKKRSYISELERDLDVSRATICYHLDILEDMKIVEQEYEVLLKPQSKKGRVRSYYKLNYERLTEVINEIRAMMPEIAR